MPAILSYHPSIEVENQTITGDLNDYYTDDEVIKAIIKQYKIKTVKEILPYLPIKLNGYGTLYLDTDSNQ